VHAFETDAERRLLDHAQHPRNGALLVPFDARARGINPLCGDTVELTLRFDGSGKVAAVGFTGVGCSVSQGAASMLYERAVGRGKSELIAIDDQELLSIVGVELNANRRKCALVALRALKDALSGNA